MTVNIPEISDTFLEAILNDQDTTFSLLDILDTLEKDESLFNKKGGHSLNDQDEYLSTNNLKDKRVPEIQQYSQRQHSSGKLFNVERVDMLSAEGSLPSHEKKKEEILSLPTEQKQSTADEVSICNKLHAQPEPIIHTTKRLPEVNAKEEARQFITYLPVSQPVIKRKIRYTKNFSFTKRKTLRSIPSTVTTKRKTKVKLGNLSMLQPVEKRRTRSTSNLSEYALRLRPSNTITKRKVNKNKIKVNKKRAAKLHIKFEDKKDQPQDSPHCREPYHRPDQELVNLSMLMPVVKRITRSTCNLRENALRLKPGNTITKRKVNEYGRKVKVNKRRSGKLHNESQDKKDRPQDSPRSREPYRCPDRELVMSMLQPVVKIRACSILNLRENTLCLKPGNTTTKRKVNNNERKIKVNKKRSGKLHFESEDKKDLPQDSPHNREPYRVPDEELVKSMLQPVVKIRTLSTCNLRENALRLNPGNTTTKRKVNENARKVNKKRASKLHIKSEETKDLPQDSPHNRAAVLEVKRPQSIDAILKNEEETSSNSLDISRMAESSKKDLFEDKNSLSEDQSNKTAVLLDVQAKCSYSPEKGCFLNADHAEDPSTDTKDEKLSLRERNLIAVRKYRQKKRRYLLQVKQSLKEKLSPSELKQLENKVFEAKLKIRDGVSEQREPNRTVRNNQKEHSTKSRAKKSVELIRKHKAGVLASRRYRERQKMCTQQLESILNGLRTSVSTR